MIPSGAVVSKRPVVATPRPSSRPIAISPSPPSSSILYSPPPLFEPRFLFNLPLQSSSSILFCSPPLQSSSAILPCNPRLRSSSNRPSRRWSPRSPRGVPPPPWPCSSRQTARRRRFLGPPSPHSRAHSIHTHTRTHHAPRATHRKTARTHTHTHTHAHTRSAARLRLTHKFADRPQQARDSARHDAAAADPSPAAVENADQPAAAQPAVRWFR